MHKYRNKYMATKIQMRHRHNGIYKDGFVGFSWTFLFFGFFVLLLRGNYAMAGIHFLIFILSGPFCWLVQIILAFYVNQWYTLNLIERGYYFDCDHDSKVWACEQLGVRMR